MVVGLLVNLVIVPLTNGGTPTPFGSPAPAPELKAASGPMAKIGASKFKSPWGYEALDMQLAPSEEIQTWCF